MNESINISFTRSQVENLIEFFDLMFFKLIADLEKAGEIDNMNYLVDMCDVYTRLSHALKEAQNEID